LLLTDVPAERLRPIVGAVGAGDALFSAYVDGWAGGLQPVDALRRATLFAAWRIGEAGGAVGLLDREALDALVASRQATEQASHG
jgi:ribokinase